MSRVEKINLNLYLRFIHEKYFDNQRPEYIPAARAMLNLLGNGNNMGDVYYRAIKLSDKMDKLGLMICYTEKPTDHYTYDEFKVNHRTYYVRRHFSHE